MNSSFLTSLKRAFSSPQGASDLEARRLVEEGACLLDVRTPGEFSGGNIPTSVNIPLQSLAGRLGELDKSRGVVVYCRSGMRSSSAASILRADGFEVYDLGGMSAWGA